MTDDELKTLKDFAYLESKDEFTHELDKLVSSNELKAEAVKWVKQDSFSVDRVWIKHFFNLTEGDLK